VNGRILPFHDRPCPRFRGPGPSHSRPLGRVVPAVLASGIAMRQVLRAGGRIQDRGAFYHGARPRAPGRERFRLAPHSGCTLPPGSSVKGMVRAWAESWIDPEPNNAKEQDILRGRLLAQEWQRIPDPKLRAEVCEHIRERWQDKGWWERRRARAHNKQELFMNRNSCSLLRHRLYMGRSRMSRVRESSR